MPSTGSATHNSTKLLTASSIMSSASIACGTVELDNSSKHHAVGKSGPHSTAAQGGLQQHQQIYLPNKINSENSETPNATTTKTTTTIPVAAAPTKTSQTATSSSVDCMMLSSSSARSMASETGTALNYLTSTSSNSDFNNRNNKKAKSTNPSIGMEDF